MEKRIIKFRGKRLDNGKWIYGGIVMHNIPVGSHANCRMAISIAKLTEGGFALFEVDHETVGQFTGLKDKNGVEIYEGDVTYQGHESMIGFVVYLEGQWIHKYDDNWFDDPLSQTYSFDEIIGNIHDNGDLT